ncbi:MAG: methyl-accepting chemotaxis protein [Thermotogae bacterium]|nr:methyl-accepting chemotaxis protein [Thermotogota bacterium]
MKSLKWRLVLIYSGLIFGLTLILGVATVIIVRGNLTLTALNNIQSIAEKEAKYVAALKEENVSYVETLSQINLLNGSDISVEEESDFFENEAKRKDYNRFFISDKSGNAKTLEKNSESMNFKNYDFFKELLKGKPVSSDILVNSKKEPLIYFASPIMSSGEITGYLIVEKNAEILSKIMANATYGETGYGYMINTKGIVIAHTNIDLVKNQSNEIENAKSNSSLKELVDMMQNHMIKGETGNGAYTYNGVQKMAGYAPVKNTPWVMIITMERKEVIDKNSLIIILVFLILGTLVVGALITLKISSMVSEPFTELSKVIGKIADYDLRFDTNSKAANYLKRKDEIGKMTNGIKVLEESLNEIVKQTKESSAKVTEAADHISLTSSQSATSSEEVAKAVTEIANSSSEQAQSTENGVVNIKEMEELLDKTQLHISELNKNAGNINALKNEGIKTVKELTEKNKENLKSTNEIKEIIFSTNESADQIQSAVQKIKDIVEQTNLLALNAAIEAARAGEAGRGFAVVAEEIRKLADDSNKFTDEINSIMDTLTGKTRNAVKTMEEMNIIVEQQSSKVTETEERFEGISSSIDNINSTIKLLTESESIIEEKKNKVVEILENLSSIAEENASSTEEVSASVEEQSALVEEVSGIAAELKGMADELGVIISKFKV